MEQGRKRETAGSKTVAGANLKTGRGQVVLRSKIAT
jgi:hypothetical protein